MPRSVLRVQRENGDRDAFDEFPLVIAECADALALYIDRAEHRCVVSADNRNDHLGTGRAERRQVARIGSHVVGDHSPARYDRRGGEPVSAWTLSWAVGRGDQVQAVIRRTRPTALVAVRLDDGTVLAMSDQGVTVWDLATGEELGDAFATETGDVLGMCVLRWPDGRDLLAVCDAARVVRLWDPQTRHPVGQPMTGAAVRNLPNGMPEFLRGMVGAHAADGRPLLAVAGHGAVRIWDATNRSMLGEVVPVTQYHIMQIAAFPRPGRPTGLAVVIADGEVHLIDPERGEVVGAPRYDPDGRASTTIAVPWPDGRLLVVSGEWTGRVRLWDAVTGARVGSTMAGHTTWISSATVLPHPDGRLLLATGSDDRTVRVWDPVSGQPVGDALVGHGKKLYQLASATGADGRARLVSSSQDATVRVWQPVNEAGARAALCRRHPRSVRARPRPGGRARGHGGRR